MNRVLRRPMFRLGGSAEGITSGLDAPNINASRKGFYMGGTDGVMDETDAMLYDEMMRSKQVGPYSKNKYVTKNEMVEGEDLDAQGDTAEIFETQDTINTRNEGTDTSTTGMDSYVKEYLDMINKYSTEPEKIKPGEPGSVSSMLTNFALNLAAQPGGNLMGAIGKAGAPAFDRFQKARLADKKQREAEKRQDVKDAMTTSASIYETAIKAAAEGKDKGFEFQSKQDTLVNLQDKEQEIRDKMAKITDTESDEYKVLQQELNNNNELKKLITKEEDLIGKMILASIAQQGPKSEGGYFEIED